MMIECVPMFGRQLMGSFFDMDQKNILALMIVVTMLADPFDTGSIHQQYRAVYDA